MREEYEKELNELNAKIVDNLRDLESEYSKAVDENFWDLVEGLKNDHTRKT